MVTRQTNSKGIRVNNQHSLEFLEHRHMLAGDFIAGDANQDYYYDEADWVHVMKFGKWETGEPATWEEGDFNGDGVFDREDTTDALGNIRDFYRIGPYDPEAGVAINQLEPLRIAGEADVSIFYAPESGNVTVTGRDGITVMHLVSRSGSFSSYATQNPLSVKTIDSRFILWLDGYSWIQFPNLLPTGWSDQQLVDDLLIDGALFGGGGLDNVRLGDLANLPDELPEGGVVIEPKNIFVEREEANGILTYDPETGDILIESLSVEIISVELKSPDGLFTGTAGAEEHYIVNNIDEATPQRFSRVAWSLEVVDGAPPVIHALPTFTTVFLPGIARTGLTEDEFFEGVNPLGTIDPSGPLKLALELGPVFAECKDYLANGQLAGDANLDGQFNSQDLVSVFQAGEYEDGFEANSTWSEGDWTCDGDFNTSDLVAAFQTGQYELAAARDFLSRSDVDRRLDPLVSTNDDVGRTLVWPGDRSDIRVKELEAATVVSNWARQTDAGVSRTLATDEVMLDLEFV